MLSGQVDTSGNVEQQSLLLRETGPVVNLQGGIYMTFLCETVVVCSFRKVHISCHRLLLFSLHKPLDDANEQE